MKTRNIITFWGLGKALCSRDNDLHQALTAILGLWLGVSICLHERLLHSPRYRAAEGRCWKALDAYCYWIKLPDMFIEACPRGQKERVVWRNKCWNRMNSFVCYTRYKETWYWVGTNCSTDRIRNVWCCGRVGFPTPEEAWGLLANLYLSFYFSCGFFWIIIVKAVLLHHFLLCLSYWDPERMLRPSWSTATVQLSEEEGS